jgi:GTP 3',8-cyclase
LRATSPRSAPGRRNRWLRRMKADPGRTGGPESDQITDGAAEERSVAAAIFQPAAVRMPVTDPLASDGAAAFPGQAPFTTVEVEVNSRCNRRCTYCPVSLNPHPDVPRMMDATVWNRLIAELSRLDFAGRFSYHFFNEPLLRRDLEDLCRDVKSSLPQAVQVLYTNGDRLSNARYRSLRAAGVDVLVVTSHSGASHPSREGQILQQPVDLRLTNRGGLLTHLPTPTSETQHLPCFAPSEMLIVGVTGDIHLCYEDATRTHVMGNIMRQPVDEIWYSAEFAQARGALQDGRRLSATDLCHGCSNRAHVVAGTSHIP